MKNYLTLVNPCVVMNDQLKSGNNVLDYVFIINAQWLQNNVGMQKKNKTKQNSEKRNSNSSNIPHNLIFF